MTIIAAVLTPALGSRVSCGLIILAMVRMFESPERCRGL